MARFLERLGYARSVCITAPLVFIATGAMGSLSLAASLVDSSGKLQHSCARFWARVVLAICRVRVRVSGELVTSGDMPCVFFANHQSHMDIPIVLVALPAPFRFAAKKELFRIPFLGWHLHRSGHIAIDRGNPHAAVKSFRVASEKLGGGTSLVFFPEGATSLDGRIGPFKGGGFVLAGRSHAVVVPVTIRGSREVLLPRTYHVRRGVVDVILGKPIPFQGFSPQELTARVRAEILATFENDETLDRYPDTILR